MPRTAGTRVVTALRTYIAIGKGSTSGRAGHQLTHLALLRHPHVRAGGAFSMAENQSRGSFGNDRKVEGRNMGPGPLV